MGRTARIDFRGRRSLPQFQRRLECSSPGDWPLQLRMAWEVLTKERSLPAEKALSVILESVAAAHRCVRAQNQLLRRNETATNCSKFQKLSKRISNGIRRSPAGLRQQLDEQLGLLIQIPIIDLEVIEAIFERTAAAFEELPNNENAATALRALRESRTTPFSQLAIEDRNHAEKALAELKGRLTADALAVDIFHTLAQTPKEYESPKSPTQTRRLIISYVAEIAELWRRAGLRPARAYSTFKSSYASKFHWFADDVLAVMVGSSERSAPGPELVHHHDLRAALRG
jgi:hypothetical protein